MERNMARPNKSKQPNYAFIDAQNIHLGVKANGWKLDWGRFFVFLQDKYQISEAYLYIGFVAENRSLYNMMQKAGFIVVFKEITKDPDGRIKGNVDADMIVDVMRMLNNYDSATLVTGDGDFSVLVRYLQKENKFARIIAPNRRYCARFLMRDAGSKIVFLDQMRHKLAVKNNSKKKRTS